MNQKSNERSALPMSYLSKRAQEQLKPRQMSAYSLAKPWVQFNPLTQTYDTPDGTSVAAERCDNVECLADVILIADTRGTQRLAKPAKEKK